jgi:hypothetical protein
MENSGYGRLLQSSYSPLRYQAPTKSLSTPSTTKKNIFSLFFVVERGLWGPCAPPKVLTDSTQNKHWRSNHGSTMRPEVCVQIKMQSA